MTTEGYTQYRRSAVAEMADWTPDFDMNGVSVSEADRSNGSPLPGDKIARNPKNHDDRWLVAAAYFADNFEPLTTEGSAEVPAGERNELLAWLDRLPAHEHLNWWDYFSDCRACALVTERATTAAAERTRLEARLAEVEAERDLAQRNFDDAAAVVAFGGPLDEAIARARDAEADLAALRAAVRPLVEAARAAFAMSVDADEWCDACMTPDGDHNEPCWAAVMAAALADPAIAALLDQQKEQG